MRANCLDGVQSRRVFPKYFGSTLTFVSASVYVLICKTRNAYGALACLLRTGTNIMNIAKWHSPGWMHE